MSRSGFGSPRTIPVSTPRHFGSLSGFKKSDVKDLRAAEEQRYGKHGAYHYWGGILEAHKFSRHGWTGERERMSALPTGPFIIGD